MITAVAIACDLAGRIHTTGFPLSWSEPSEIFFTRENPHSHSVPVIISTSVIVRDQITGLTFDNHLPWHSDYASVYNATSGQSVSINETLPARHKLTAKNRIPLSRGTDQCSEMRHGYEESTSNRQKYKHEGFVLDVVITPI